MPTNDAVLRLLLIDDRIEDAEQLTSLLRNGGLAVRPQRPDSVEELRHHHQLPHSVISFAGFASYPKLG